MSGFGNCLHLDGDGDYVDVGDISDIGLTDEFSISLWAKTPQPNNNDGYRYFYGLKLLNQIIMMVIDT